jgi:hypothetical protein
MGFALFSIGLWTNSYMNADAAFAELFWPQALRGLALMLYFVQSGWEARSAPAVAWVIESHGGCGMQFIALRDHRACRSSPVGAREQQITRLGGRHKY